MKCFEFITVLIYTSDRLSSLLATAAEANGYFEPSGKMMDKQNLLETMLKLLKRP